MIKFVVLLTLAVFLFLGRSFRLYRLATPWVIVFWLIAFVVAFESPARSEGVASSSEVITSFIF